MGLVSKLDANSSLLGRCQRQVFDSHPCVNSTKLYSLHVWLITTWVHEQDLLRQQLL